MFRKLRSVLSAVLALAICLSVVSFAAAAPATKAEAADRAVPLSATRYRYPIMRFENAKFRNGVPIDKNNSTSAYLSSDSDKSNGPASTDLINAYVDEYDMFNMKLGKNKALYIHNKENTSPIVAENYIGYSFHFGKDVDTREDIFPASIQGVPIDATDHGIMLHVEVKGTPEHPEDGFCHVGYNKGEYTDSKSTHVQKDVNITFQEWDYKPDGTPKKKKGKVVTTARNIKPGAKITLIWTRQIDWVNPDSGKEPGNWSWDNTEYARNADGSGVKETDAEGNTSYKRQLIPDRHHKPGDVEILTTPTKTLENKNEGGGGMTFPRDFCGYVIIPFSEFQMAWDGGDYDGMLNFKKMELANLYSGSYCYHRGTVIYDEYCFWGPTFAKVDGAFDYGNISFSNHKESMNNRKRITIKEEKPSEKPSVEAPSEIKKDVTLTNKDTGIVIEAPASAKLDAKAKFNVEILDPDGDDYSKQLYDKLFGKDRTLYKSYNLYLGEDGDQEPADFVQINFPIPEGLDGKACKVYTLTTTADVDKAPVESTLSADGKTISIKTNKLGTYIIFEEGKGGAVSEETGSEQQEDGSTADTPVDSTSKADGETSSEEKSEEKSSANLLWLWIVLGVVAAGGIAVAVVLIVKKGKKVESGSDENENKDENTEE